VVGPQSYIMGIIDFQQQWNIKKKVLVDFDICGPCSLLLVMVPPAAH
jgi:hypothetical protein